MMPTSRQASFHTHVAVALAVARGDDADPVSLRVPVGDGNKPPVGFEPTTSRLLSGCSTN